MSQLAYNDCSHQHCHQYTNPYHPFTQKKNNLPFTSCRFGYPANHAIDTTTDKIIGPDSTYNWCCQNENRVYGNNIIHTGSGEYDLIQGPDGRLQCCRRK